MLKRKLMAEFLGTYFLVFAGTGAIIVNDLTKSLTHIGIALTFGLVVMALIYGFGHISGAHFNPAVTIGFAINGEMNWKEAVYYIFTQIGGAIAASISLLFMFGNTANLGSTLPNNTWQQSFGLEFILTFALMLIIFSSAVHAKAVKPFAGIAIGAVVCLEVIVGGPISGASMNPARSLSPALFSNTFDYLWIYLFATTLGAVSAAFVYRYLHD